MTCWQYQTNFAKHSVNLQEAHGPHHSSGKKTPRCRFSNFVYVFSVHCNNLPSKSAWFLIWINLNPLHPQILCAKFGWYCPSGSGEVDFKILPMYFGYFIIIPPPPWKRALPFIWTTWIPFTQGVWLKLAQWFWRRRWKCDKFTDSLTTADQIR